MADIQGRETETVERLESALKEIADLDMDGPYVSAEEAYRAAFSQLLKAIKIANAALSQGEQQ